MKPLTIILIVVVVLVAIAGIVVRVIDIRTGKPEVVPTPTPAPLTPIQISVITAMPAEPWVTQAAEKFNQEEYVVNGRPITVEVIPMDGLSALNKWAKGEFDTVPTAWIAESRAWVEQANVAALERTGQDIFLAGGRYRSQPVALSPLVWGIWQDAFDTLSQYMGTKEISWDELHKAAVIGSWNEMGGDPDRGIFKMVVAHPKRDPAGLTAMVGAAGEYYDKPVVTTDELQNPQFLNWLADLFDTVVDFSPFGIENMFLFGRSNGDAGQMVESYLLVNMENLEKRWQQPLIIVYPDPIAWFDFPYSIYMGKETTADEKQAALDFKNYLLSATQQTAALDYGLRPATAEVASDGGLIAQWTSLGVMGNIPSASRMRAASRKGLEALTQWYVKKYEE
jgi:Ca-activated chloride channel family protein